MLNKIWTYLIYNNLYIGIEHTSIEQDEAIYACIVKQSSKELNLIHTFKKRTVKEICNKLPKNHHATLVINNNKVLFKSIESNYKDPLKLVNHAFPNININDFYFEILTQSNNINFIALCRKDDVNRLILEYEKQNISIIAISLGNCALNSVSNFFKDDVIYTSNCNIQFKDKQIIAINKGNTFLKTYNINGLTLLNTHLLSFSAALKIILNNNTNTNNFLDYTKKLLLKYKEKRFFIQFLKASIVFILVTLLINFLIFNYYFNKNSSLEQVSKINQSAKNNIVKLNKIVSEKDKMISDLLKSKSSKSSFYVDRIIKKLPKSILLSDIKYQPLLKSIKQLKKIEINKNVIEVYGTTANNEIFSSWLNQLEKSSWIHKIDIINFGVSSSTLSHFEIKIILKNDK